MTTLLVVIVVLIVISLALDVLILASVGNLIAQLINPDRKERERIQHAIAQGVKEADEASRKAQARVPVSHYDA